ncbi:MAG: hypothetical protein MJ181_07365 [Treponema sp.]|nr:hypothetical protein [Treponema sp.]
MSFYKLAFDCRYFTDEENIYLRKGIWNTIDGIIPFSNLHDKSNFLSFLETVKNEREDEQKIHFNKMSASDKNIAGNLLENNFIFTDDSESLEICRVLTGQQFNLQGKEVKFQLITDSNLIDNQLQQLKEIYQYEYKIVPQEILEQLKQVNYFSRVDELAYQKKASFIKYSLDQSPVLYITQNINLNLIRNLNKIVEDTPIFIGFIDGPFMIFLSIIPKQTGCWECFEQRMLSYVKDNTLYDKFSTLESSGNSRIYNLHLISLLHTGLQEVFSWNLLHMSKFMGRCMFTFLPTMEIHFENVNRISSCRTCGYIAEIENEEHNARLGRLIEEYITETGITNDLQ